MVASVRSGDVILLPRRPGGCRVHRPCGDRTPSPGPVEANVSDQPSAPPAASPGVPSPALSREHGSEGAVARALELVRLFADPGPSFATFRSVDRGEVPEPARTLLDHTRHMTVAMEAHYGAPLGLRVVARARDLGATDGHNPWYAREILLLSPEGALVQYGIVRINLSHVDQATALAIRAGRIPLGRVLINAGLLREVHDVSLLEVRPGPRLASLFGGLPVPGVPSAPTYGRVAEISLGGHPAVELLEVVVPPTAS